MTGIDKAASPVPSYQDGLRMQAYYYGFDFTGVEAIDRILSAVAVAGKAYHSTDSWDESPYGDEDGPSCAEHIQLAANAAAVEWHLRSGQDITESLIYCVDAGHWTGYECPPDCPGVWPFLNTRHHGVAVVTPAEQVAIAAVLQWSESDCHAADERIRQARRRLLAERPTGRDITELPVSKEGN